jgi:DNA primase
MSKKHNNRGGNNSKGNKAMKYMVRADIKVNGTVQRKDIIGAIMGQTEGLLGDELELRKLQRTARIGHVDVEMENKGGKVHGLILIPSSLDNVETAIIASSLETIDRIGPCTAKISVMEIQDIRATKRTVVVDRAKELLLDLVNSGEAASKTVIEEVRSVLTVGTAKQFHGLTCGPNIETSSSLIVVEGRNDVRNLLNCGVKNAISADGAGSIKQELIDLANGKETVVLAIDGDRGGEMLFSQLNEMMKVDFVAQAPVGQEWELLPQKTVTKCLSMKVEAAKFAHQIKQKQEKDDKKAGVEDKNWAEDMDDTFEKPSVPKEVEELFSHLDELAPRKAVFVMMDGTVTEPVGPKDLASTANEADGAIAIIYNGSISDKTLDIASEAAIETVIGTKQGKGYGERDDVKSWLTEVHR